MTKPLIALDCDGVLLDYNLAYAKAWSRFTGVYPAESDPLAYWPMDRWDVQQLVGDQLAMFRTAFDTEFWSSIPPIAGAIEACYQLHDHGYQLVCITALDDRFVQARLKNLRELGFPIEKIFGVSHQVGPKSPKADIIENIQPVAFVDDFLPYMAGIRSETHTALILRGPNGSPNMGAGMEKVKSTHVDLAAFSHWWLTRAKCIVQTNGTELIEAEDVKDI